MKKIELSYAEIEQLQHILNVYMQTFKEHMGDKHYESLDSLKLKLIAMRAQLEYLRTRTEE